MKIPLGIIITTFLMVMAISNIANAWNQIARIENARRENEEISKQILKLEEENRKLELGISFATSSAFIQQQARKELGLGGDNDYWLNLPDDEIDYESVVKTEEEEVVPNWKQ